MDVLLGVMHKEEKKLLAMQDRIAGRLTGLRAAINALSTNVRNGSARVAHRGSKLRGRHLSAAHRKAIKAGIAKARAAKAKA
jgi:hypothetical protein